MSNVPQEVIDAAKALIQRWDTPLWRQAEHTGTFIYRLRDAVSAYEAQRSNAEPVAYVLVNEHGDMVMWSQDRSVSEYDQKAFWPKTKIVDLYSAPPDYAAGVAAGMMKAAEICKELSCGVPGSDLVEHILSAIPADSKAALRERDRKLCMKVAGKMMDACTDFYYGKTTLEVSTQAIVNSVLEGKS